MSEDVMRKGLMENLDPETLQTIANGSGVGWTDNERRYAAILATAKCPHCGQSLRIPEYKLCRFCGQPVKPKGVKKKLGEYDHAQGCPYSRLRSEPAGKETK